METETYRRFIPIGTEKQMDKLKTLVEEKNLSREDLAVILRAITLNQGDALDLAVIKNELQDIRTILEFIRAEIGAMDMDTDTIMENWAADLEKKLSLSEKAFIAACDNLKCQSHVQKVLSEELRDNSSKE